MEPSPFTDLVNRSSRTSDFVVRQAKNGIDFNLTVDRIEIDGVSSEAEAAETFHSGVFRDGFLQSGFFETETLQGNGFFQFNNSPQNSPRYAFDDSVSEDGPIEFTQASALTATSFSDGSFVGTTQQFGFGGPIHCGLAHAPIRGSRRCWLRHAIQRRWVRCDL